MWYTEFTRAMQLKFIISKMATRGKSWQRFLSFRPNKLTVISQIIFWRFNLKEQEYFIQIWFGIFFLSKQNMTWGSLIFEANQGNAQLLNTHKYLQCWHIFPDPNILHSEITYLLLYFFCDLYEGVFGVLKLEYLMYKNITSKSKEEMFNITI